MNTTNQIAAVKAELSTVSTLAEQLRAMHAAVAREGDLQRKLAQLEAQQADADRAAEAKVAAVARFQNIRITGAGKGHPLMDDYAINYVETSSDLMTMQPVQRPGKQSLTGPSVELYAAVLANPEVIPAAIRTLHADPDQAIRLYVRGKARGYVAG